MYFKTTIFISIFILLCQNAYSGQSYTMYSESKVAAMSLKDLIVHRAEVFAAEGYEFKSDFLKKEMAKRSWYNPLKKYSYKKFSKRERNYLSLLSKYIDKHKGKELESLNKKLSNYLAGRMEIKFSHLADLDSDGYFDLVAVCGKKFPVPENSLTDEASYHYYTNYNELYLIVIGKNFFSQVKLSNEVQGRAEYVNKFESDYFMNNGKAQVKVILHSLPVVNSNYGPHKENLFLFNLESGKLRKVFEHQIYNSFYQGKKEKITEFDYDFKNLTGDAENELELTKYKVNVTYKEADSIKKSHTEKKIKLQSLFFEYDRGSRSYRRFNLKYRKNKN